MAALVGGHTYGLSSHDKNSKSKTLIFVKLTDSALKSIEEYVKGTANSVLKPTIQFKANNGVIRLSSGDSHVKSYGFNLSSVETDGPQGSFECEQEKGSRSLESLGSMHVRMHVNANEDSYEKTRVKMAAVEKENKKFCTKEIKPSGPYVGRKVKLKPSLSSIPPKASSPLYINPPSKSSSKLFTNSVSTSANQLSSSINSARQINGNRIAKHMSAVQSQSCRNRIIHLLALRPYSTSELILKLTSEGIKEGEKKNIAAIVSQVAVLKDKEHSYTLTNDAWDEVQDDWKFYTQEEADTVRMRKLWNLKSRSENRVSSPTSMLCSNSPTQKRALSEWEINNTDNRWKKQRISHINRQSNTAPNVVNPSRAETTNGFMNGEKFIGNSHNMKKEMNGHVQNSYNMKKEMNGHAPNSYSLKKEMNGHAPNSHNVKKEINGHAQNSFNVKKEPYDRVQNSVNVKKEMNGHVQMYEASASLGQKHNSYSDLPLGTNNSWSKEICEEEKMDIERTTVNQRSPNETYRQNGESKPPNWLSANYKNKVGDYLQKNSNYAAEKAKESHRMNPVEKHSSKTEEYRNPSSKTEEYRNPSSKTEEYRNPSSKTEEYRNPSSKTEEYRNPSSKTEEYRNPSSKTEEYRNPSIKMEEYRNPSSKIEEYRNLSGKTEYRNTFSKAEEYRNTSSKTEEYRNTSSKTEEYRNTSSKTEEYRNTSSKTEEYRNLSSKAEEYQNPSSRMEEYRNPVHHGKVNGITQQKNDYSNDLDSNSLHATNAKRNGVTENKKLSNGYHNGYINGSTGNNHNHSLPMVISTKEVREADSSEGLSWDEQKHSLDHTEYFKQYPGITSREQRARYKRDFNVDYEVYKELHDRMKRIANKFTELENKLKRSQQQENASDYQEIQREIIEKYSDPSCFSGKKKLNYLHEKLSHIKKLVMEYDRSHVISS